MTADLAVDAEAFRRRFAELARYGRDEASGAQHRLAWTPADAHARAAVAAEAQRLGLTVEVDGNGNHWAWWWPEHLGAVADLADGAAVATGSHLDSVPGGGAFDGPLGVVSALGAVEALSASGWRPRRPLAVVVWADEEGGRFSTPCFGSRLAAGTLDPADVLDRRDADGVRLADALHEAGVDPAGLGPDPERLRGLGVFVELHIEQGRALAPQGAPLGVGTGVWPHGRWRVDLAGVTDHAGTTRLDDRRDAALGLAALVTAAREESRTHGAVATVGRARLAPGATNAVPGGATGWLDARAGDDATLEALVAAVRARVDAAAAAEGLAATVTEESRTPEVVFDADVRARLEAVVAGVAGAAPRLPTAAGHDAATLAGVLPTGMLYVRNPTGASHTPAEHADEADCLLGVRALAAALREFAG